MEGIGSLADVPVEVSVHLDHRIMTVREVLRLNQGSVLRLERSAGENVDFYVGDVLLGCGEVVIVENTVAVRLTDFKMGAAGG